MKLVHDVRTGLRSLVRNPAFTVTAVLCLALGVGANVAMFRVVDALVFSPPAHVRDADRLVRVYVEKTYPGIGPILSGSFAYPFVRQLAEGADSLDPAAYGRTELSVDRGADARRAAAVLAGPRLFDVLGVETAIGRWPTEEEAHPSEPASVAVLGHGFWQGRFGGDPGVLGKHLRVGEGLFTVVGVAPPGFTGAELEAVDLWLPLGFMGRLRSHDWYQNDGARFLKLIARLAPGAASERATGEATALLTHSEEQSGSSSPEGRVVLGPLLEARGPYQSREVQVARWLAGLALFVLLIACANVASLQLARTLRRRRALAVQVSLGAGRWDIVRRQVTEMLIVALLGAFAAGVALMWTEEALRVQLLPGAPAPTAAAVLRLAVVTGALALFAGLVAALPAAAQAWRRDLTAGIRSETGGGSAGPNRTQAALVMAQVALGLVLLVGTGLFLESLREVRSIEIGLEPGRVLVAHVDLREREPSPVELRELYGRMRQRAGSSVGVASTGLAAGVPLETTFGTAASVPGGEPIPSLPTGGPYIHPVSPGFFETLGIDLIRGRRFDEAVDTGGAPPVVIVNETMAEQVWPGEEALGRCLLLGDEGAPCTRVVGVAEDTLRQRLGEGPTLQLYVPLDQAPEPMGAPGALLIRLGADEERTPEQMAALLREQLQTVRRDLPYLEVRPLSALLDPQLRTWQLGFRMLGLFGVLALVLATLGTYSVMLYTVAQRTRELGVRIALGADRATVVRGLVRQGLRVAAAGVALGLAMVLLGGRFIRPLLYQVDPWDPVTLSVASLVLTAAVVAAGFFPARRAAKLDPVQSLQVE